MSMDAATSAATPAATVTALNARAVMVPMARPLVTSGGAVEIAPLVLVDIEADDGTVGHAYVLTYTPRALAATLAVCRDLADLVVGQPLAPLALDARLRQTCKLVGTTGVIGMALAGLDMAAWDAAAKSAGLPLVRLLGATPRPIPAYNSNGLGMIGATAAVDEAKALAEGFGAIKVRLGYPTVAEDLAVVEAVRAAVGHEITVMSDYNQSLTVAEARVRVRALADAGLAWIEEPTRADDYAGYAEIRNVSPTPIQLGENYWGPNDMAAAIAAGAGDYMMPDAMRIGGVTGWMRAAALAQPGGIPLSSHLFPEVSVHLLAATPTSHWLEYVDWAGPILAQPMTLTDGHALPGVAPGTGIAWNEEAVARYLV